MDLFDLGILLRRICSPAADVLLLLLLLRATQPRGGDGVLLHEGSSLSLSLLSFFLLFLSPVLSGLGKLISSIASSSSSSFVASSGLENERRREKDS